MTKAVLWYFSFLLPAVAHLCAAPLATDEKPPLSAQDPTPTLTIYVAPNGNDQNDGSAAAPFASLERARDEARAIMRRAQRAVPVGAISVVLRGGVFLRDHSFVLEKKDSGVTYRSEPQAPAHLIGGKSLQPTWFRPVTVDSPLWPRLSPAGQGKILEVDLRTHGMTDFGQLLPRGMHHPDRGAMELFINGLPMPIAQWPDASSAELQGMDTGFSRIVDVVGPKELLVPEVDLARWSHADQLWLHGYWGNYWSDFHLSAAAIDPVKKTITLTQAPSYAMRKGMPFRVYNLIEELTQPGEWFLDRPAGKLYVWPTTDWAQAEIFVSTLPTELIMLKNTDGVVLENLVLELSWSRLLTITDGRHNQVRHCLLRNSGTDGADISGLDNGIIGCRIENTGECGVRLSGGSRAQLISAGNYVRDSRLSHFSRWTRTYTPGIEMQGVGQIAAHNAIYDAPHAAILFFGNNHRIEFNDIHDVCLFSCDAGAIYAGRRWDFRGNVIQFNFIHRLHSPLEEPNLGENGIYLDDCISGTTVTGNILYDITGDGILCNGGRDNAMTGNVMVKCGTALEISAFAVKHASEKPGSSWNLVERFSDDGVRYQAEPWASAYPQLAAIPPDWTQLRAPGARWLYPENSTFEGNVAWQNGHFIRRTNVGENTILAQVFRPKNNLEGSDPRFRDASKSDFTLPLDSPALALSGFKPIPFADIGPPPDVSPAHDRASRSPQTMR